MALYDSNFSSLAKNVLESKYLQGRTWNQCVDDIVESICNFNEQTRKLWSEAEIKLLREAIYYRWFLPGGRYIYYSNKKKNFYNNCILLGTEDSREGWSKTVYDAFMCLMSGAGIGIDYSCIRGKGSKIEGTGGYATGPIALMKAINSCGSQIMQGGSRRCISAGSKVYTKNGLVNIEDIKVGDEVLTYNGYHKVLNNFKQGKQVVYKVVTKNDVIECTENHRLAVSKYVSMNMTTDKTTYGYEWKQLKDIKKELLVKYDIDNDNWYMEKIKEVQEIGEKETYDIEVEIRNEFVCEGFLVHNSAMYASLVWNHEDIFDFINAKNWSITDKLRKEENFFNEAPLDMTNISVRLDKNFWNELDNGGELANKVFDKTIMNMLKTSEPGFQSDLDGKIFRNACFTADTKIITSRGELTILEIVKRFENKEDLNILSYNFKTKGLEWKKLLKAWKTAENQPIMEVDVLHRESIHCTLNHNFYTVENGKKEAKSLLRREKMYFSYYNVNINDYDMGYNYIQNLRILDNREDVYNITVEENHNYFANGVLVANCTEVISDTPYDICNLGSINLGRLDTKEEFARIVNVATKFLYCGSIASEVPLKEIQAVKERNRRLGLGLMGVHEWILKRNFKYGMNDNLRSWMEIYKNGSEETADECARKTGLSKPVATTSIAPTGTISLISGTTSGIEPIYSVAYARKYIVGERERKVEYVVDATAKRLIDEGYVKNPEEIEDAMTLAKDPERRVRFQWELQKYVSMAISSTINLPNFDKMENREQIKLFEDMKYILKKYLKELRGITCYSDSSRRGQPLEKIDYHFAKSHEGVVYDETSKISCKSGICGM